MASSPHTVLLSWAVLASFAAPQLAAVTGKITPTFGEFYEVGGLLQLPYAEIKEPFYAFYDATANKSRVDFYNKMVVTIQHPDLGPYGTSYKIAPVSNYKVLNQKTCFFHNGTVNDTVSLQSALPDLTDFKYIMSDMMSGMKCDVWRNIIMKGKKKNVYTMWVDAVSGAPVRYEMFGYDTLLGSHYDKYYIDYDNFNRDKPLNCSFIVPEELTCTTFFGPGVMSENRLLTQPLQEYIQNSDQHIHDMFGQFKSTHKRKYADENEHAERETNFRHNVRFIHSKNRAGLTYTMKVNHLADRNANELKYMLGRLHSKGYNGGLPFNHKLDEYVNVPDVVDWRLYGAVTPVKDQGPCGSCWSFGTVGTIEGALFIQTGYQIRLSQQELMDCSWGEGNNACDGGEDYRSYRWIIKNGGITSEEQYGDYLAQDGYCRSMNVTPVARIKNYVNVTSGNELALKLAIAKYGPISVSIHAAQPSLSFYSDGVYYEPDCPKDEASLNHNVLAVGYGVIHGEPYWLIKNSWSTYWGNDGYVLMSQKNNNCGVTTAPTFVNLM